MGREKQSGSPIRKHGFTSPSVSLNPMFQNMRRFLEFLLRRISRAISNFTQIPGLNQLS